MNELLLDANKQLLNKLRNTAYKRFELTDMGVRVEGARMNVTRDLNKAGTITINQIDYTEEIVEHVGMKDCNLTLTSRAGNVRPTTRRRFDWTRKASSGTNQSLLPPCTSHRFPGMTSSTP